jgi:hypothetical protein
MIVVSTGASDTCIGAFLAEVFGRRIFLATGFVALIPARPRLDAAVFGAARFAAFLSAGLALALPRFELFLRAATRFFALAMAVSCVCRQENYVDIISRRFATRFNLKFQLSAISRRFATRRPSADTINQVMIGRQLLAR